jgi:ribosomal protein L34E
MKQSFEYKHEPKACARCHAVFECKVGNVENCQCQSVYLNDEIQKQIHTSYEDCLCASCLKEVKKDYYFQLIQEKVKRLFFFR